MFAWHKIDGAQRTHRHEKKTQAQKNFNNLWNWSMETPAWGAMAPEQRRTAGIQ